QIGADRLRLMAQSNGLAAPLLGESELADQTDERGIYGEVGSSAAGAFAQKSWDGFTLRAGLAYQEAGFSDAKIEHQFMFGATARYMFTPNSNVRPFVELGGWTSSNGQYRFNRSYANGTGTAIGSGVTDGREDYAFARLGAVFAVSKSDAAQLTL